MKNHAQLNPIIADFKRIDVNYFGDIQGIIFHLPPAKTRFQPYFPSCLPFYRRVAELSPFVTYFETVPSTLSSIWYPRQLAKIAAILKSCRFCAR